MLKTTGAVILEFLYAGQSWPSSDEAPTYEPTPSFTSTSAAAQIIQDVYKYNGESSGSGSSSAKNAAKKPAAAGGGGDAKKPGAGGGDAKKPAAAGGGGGGGAAAPGAAANSAAKEKQMAFRVPMCCGECADAIVSMLTQMSGVKAVDCDVPKEKVSVKASASVMPEEVLRNCRKLFKKSTNWE